MNIGEEVTLKVTGRIYKMEASNEHEILIHIKNDDLSIYLNISEEELNQCRVSS